MQAIIAMRKHNQAAWHGADRMGTTARQASGCGKELVTHLFTSNWNRWHRFGDKQSSLPSGLNGFSGHNSGGCHAIDPQNVRSRSNVAAWRNLRERPGR
jgi:hypothetical protein